MRKLNILLMLILSTFLLSCSTMGIDGGEELVIVKKPWFFGSSGVVDTPDTEGRSYLAWSTSGVRYDVKPLKYEEVFDDVMTYDNNPVDFSAYIILQIENGTTPYIHSNFGINWYDNNIEDQYRAMVRNACSKYPMFVLSTNRKIVDSLENVIRLDMENYITKLGLPVKTIQVIIGKVSPPKEVLDETVKTAAAIQSIKTQESRVLAEKAREFADLAKSNADQAYLTNFKGMTINQYLILRQLEIEKEKIEMIKGKENVSIVMQSSSNGVIPTIPLK